LVSFSAEFCKIHRLEVHDLVEFNVLVIIRGVLEVVVNLILDHGLDWFFLLNGGGMTVVWVL